MINDTRTLELDRMSAHDSRNVGSLEVAPQYFESEHFISFGVYYSDWNIPC